MSTCLPTYKTVRFESLELLQKYAPILKRLEAFNSLQQLKNNEEFRKNCTAQLSKFEIFQIDANEFIDYMGKVLVGILPNPLNNGQYARYTGNNAFTATTELLAAFNKYRGQETVLTQKKEPVLPVQGGPKLTSKQRNSFNTFIANPTLKNTPTKAVFELLGDLAQAAYTAGDEENADLILYRKLEEKLNSQGAEVQKYIKCLN